MNVELPAKDKMFTETAGADANQLLKERVAWSVTPLMLIGFALFWVLNPLVVATVNLQAEVIVAFAMGITLALVGSREEIKTMLDMNVETGAYVKNRIPSEFYWGNKEVVLFKADKK